VPGFDDGSVGFDAAVGFDASGDGTGGTPTFPVTGWDGISLSIEVAFVVDEFIIGESLIGITPLGPVPEWTDITQYVQGWSSKRGRQRALERAQTGSLRLDLLNTDGRFDPTNLSGPYVADGATQVLPGCPVRVRIEYDGTTHDVWRGCVDAWPGTWAKGPATSAPAFVGLEASGVFDWPAGVDLKPGPPLGIGEKAGARVHRILDAINWPSFARDIDTGVATMQDTTLEGPVVDLLQRAADSDGGYLYESADGSIAFRDRNSSYTGVSLTSQAVFGDNPAAVLAGTELPYFDVTFDYSKDLVKNDVTLAREESDTFVNITDGYSRRKYGPRSYDNTELMNETDAGLIPLAQIVIAQSADPELRFESITIRPRRDPERLWPVVLGLDLRHRVTIIRRPASGNTIEQDCFIESISHSCPRQGEYEIVFGLSAAQAFTAQPFIIGTSLLGGTDVLVF